MKENKTVCAGDCALIYLLFLFYFISYLFVYVSFFYLFSFKLIYFSCIWIHIFCLFSSIRSYKQINIGVKIAATKRNRQYYHAHVENISCMIGESEQRSLTGQEHKLQDRQRSLTDQQNNNCLLANPNRHHIKP